MTPAARRVVLLCLGWAFVGLGILGVVLPVLPTTPFMLVALWCFARSSERFHAWLYNHALFGPPLRQWERHRVIPLRAKAVALAAMTASMVYMAFFSGAHELLIGLAGIVIAFGAWFILTKPSRAPAEERKDEPLRP